MDDRKKNEDYGEHTRWAKDSLDAVVIGFAKDQNIDNSETIQEYRNKLLFYRNWGGLSLFLRRHVYLRYGVNTTKDQREPFSVKIGESEYQFCGISPDSEITNWNNETENYAEVLYKTSEKKSSTKDPQPKKSAIQKEEYVKYLRTPVVPQRGKYQIISQALNLTQKEQASLAKHLGIMQYDMHDLIDCLIYIQHKKSGVCSISKTSELLAKYNDIRNAEEKKIHSSIERVIESIISDVSAPETADQKITMFARYLGNSEDMIEDDTRLGGKHLDRIAYPADSLLCVTNCISFFVQKAEEHGYFNGENVNYKKRILDRYYAVRKENRENTILPEGAKYTNQFKVDLDAEIQKTSNADEAAILPFLVWNHAFSKWNENSRTAQLEIIKLREKIIDEYEKIQAEDAIKKKIKQTKYKISNKELAKIGRLRNSAKKLPNTPKLLEKDIQASRIQKIAQGDEAVERKDILLFLFYARVLGRDENLKITKDVVVAFTNEANKLLEKLGFAQIYFGNPFDNFLLSALCVPGRLAPITYFYSFFSDWSSLGQTETTEKSEDDMSSEEEDVSFEKWRASFEAQTEVHRKSVGIKTQEMLLDSILHELISNFAMIEEIYEAQQELLESVKNITLESLHDRAIAQRHQSNLATEIQSVSEKLDLLDQISQIMLKILNHNDELKVFITDHITDTFVLLAVMLLASFGCKSNEQRGSKNKAIASKLWEIAKTAFPKRINSELLGVDAKMKLDIFLETNEVYRVAMLLAKNRKEIAREQNTIAGSEQCSGTGQQKVQP